MNFPNLYKINKRSYFIIAGVVIFIIIGILSVILNKRESVQNPSLPAQVGQLTELSPVGEEVANENIAPTRTATENTNLTTTESPVAENTGMTATTAPANENTGMTVTEAPQDAFTVEAVNNVITVEEFVDNTGKNQEDVPLPGSRIDELTSECIDPFTGGPCTTEEEEPLPGGRIDQFISECIDPFTGGPCTTEEEPVCGTLTTQPCTINPLPKEPMDVSIATADENGCTDPTGGAIPCPEEPGCVNANGVPISCDPIEIPCGIAAGDPCPEPECDPNTGANCGVEFDFEPAEPETPNFEIQEPEPEIDICDRAFEDCEPKQSFCDPGVEDCEPKQSFCDPGVEDCEEQEVYVPPAVTQAPPSNLNPVASVPPTQTVQTVKTVKNISNAPGLHESGPGNIILLLTAPTLAYLATRRKK